MVDDCIFCKIIKGDIPSTKVYEDDQAMAFRDINPAAPTHVIIVPRQHISGITKADANNAALLGHLMVIAAQVARDEGIEEGGYRVVTNVGADGGQSVNHLHWHLLGGRKLSWPPG